MAGHSMNVRSGQQRVSRRFNGALQLQICLNLNRGLQGAGRRDARNLVTLGSLHVLYRRLVGNFAQHVVRSVLPAYLCAYNPGCVVALAVVS